MSKLTFALAALVAVPLLSTSAHADSKALAAAQKTLGGSANIVFGVNIGSITSTKFFKDTVWPALVAKGGADMKEGLDLANKQCGIDPLKAVSDIVIAVDSNAGDKAGVVFIGLNDKIDQAKLEACVTKMGAAKKKPTPKFAKDGNVIEMTDKSGDKKYYSWVTADVIAVSMKDGDKPSLKTWTGGKGLDAKSGVGALFAKTKTTGAVYGAANIANKLSPKIDVKGGYGWIGMGGGKLDIEAHALMADAKSATAAATEANTQIGAIKKSGGLPPGIVKMIDGVKINGVGSETVVTSTMTEADVGMLFSLMMMKL